MIRAKFPGWLFASVIIFLFHIHFVQADSVTTYACSEYLDTDTGKAITEYPSVLEKRKIDGRSAITWRGRGLNPLRPSDMWEYGGLKVGEVSSRKALSNEVYMMLGGVPADRPMAPYMFEWQLEHGYPVIVQERPPLLVMFFVFPDSKLIGETPHIEKVTCHFNKRVSSQ